MKYLRLVLLVGIASQSTIATELERITVTSTRQPQSTFDVERSIYTVAEQRLLNLQAEHVNQVLARVPGAWISRGNGQEHLTAIRSPVLSGAGGCGAFYIAQDGISARAPGFCNANQLFDLNTQQAGAIEVLNGPNSVAYGSNAVHGVINVISPDISSERSSYLALDAGPHDYQRMKFDLSQTRTTHGLAVYGHFTDDGGYKDSSGYEQQKLNLLHQVDAGRWRIKSIAAYSNLDQQTAGFVQGFQAYKQAELRRQNPNPDAFRQAKSARLYSQIRLQADEQTVLTVTPYVRWADMTFLQHYLPWQSVESNRQTSAGVQSQYTKQFDDMHLLSGFDIDLTRGKLVETQQQDFAASIPQGEHYNYVVDAQVYSPFFMLDWSLTPLWSVRVGARFEHTEYDYDNTLSTGSACASGVQNCRFTRPPDQTVTYAQWSYQGALHHQLNDHQNVYLQLSRGYRAPQATELFRLQAGQILANLKAETLDALEVGIKGFTDKLNYQLSVYRMEKDHFIFQDTLRQNISDGQTSHQGVEAQLHFQLDRQWYAALNASYGSHRYDNDVAISQQSIRGNRIDTAPQTLASAQIGWAMDTGLAFEIDWVYQSEYYLDPENTVSYAGHQLLNLRAKYALSPRLQVNLRVINALDNDYAERADYAFGNYRYFVGEPRALYLGIKWQLAE